MSRLALAAIGATLLLAGCAGLDLREEGYRVVGDREPYRSRILAELDADVKLSEGGAVLFSPDHATAYIAGSGAMVDGARIAIVAADLSTGRNRWEVRAANPDPGTGESAEDAALTADGSTLLVASQRRISPDRDVVANYVEVLALDAATGEERWTWTYRGGSAFPSAVAVDDEGGRVFVAVQRGGPNVFALGLANGSEIWNATFDAGDSYVRQLAIAPGAGTLYVTVGANVVAASMEDGTERWRGRGGSFKPGGTTSSSRTRAPSSSYATRTARWSGPRAGAREGSSRRPGSTTSPSILREA